MFWILAHVLELLNAVGDDSRDARAVIQPHMTLSQRANRLESLRGEPTVRACGHLRCLNPLRKANQLLPDTFSFSSPLQKGCNGNAATVSARNEPELRHRLCSDVSVLLS